MKTLILSHKADIDGLSPVIFLKLIRENAPKTTPESIYLYNFAIDDEYGSSYNVFIIPK